MPEGKHRLTRREALQAIGGAAAAAALVPPAFSVGLPQPGPPAEAKVATSSFSVTAVKRASIPLAFIGMSFEKLRLGDDYFSLSRPGRTKIDKLFQLLSAAGQKGVLRIGADTVEKLLWQVDGHNSSVTSQADLDGLAQVLKQTGWKCLYGLNLLKSAEVDAALERTRAEAAAVYKTLGSLLLGFEIGNEPDQHQGKIKPTSYDYDAFEADWQKVYDAVRPVTGSVAFTGPAGGAKEKVGWTVHFSQTKGTEVNLLTHHYYRGSNTMTVPQLLSYPDPKLELMLQTLLMNSIKTRIPFRIAEANSIFRGGEDRVSNAFASALWVLDLLFTCALGGASGVDIQGGNAGAGPGLYSPLGFTKDGDITVVEPIFYGMKLFQMAGAGPILTTGVSRIHDLNVSAYAIQPSPERTSIVVVNKEESTWTSLSVTLPVKATSATLLELRAPALNARDGVTIGGSPIGVDASFTPQTYPLQVAKDGALRFFVPPAAAVLVQAT